MVIFCGLVYFSYFLNVMRDTWLVSAQNRESNFSYNNLIPSFLFNPSGSISSTSCLALPFKLKNTVQNWSCRIHQLQLCSGVRPHQWESWYDTKQSDGEVPVMLKLWGMQSTPSLSLLPGPLWSGMVAPDRALSMG